MTIALHPGQEIRFDLAPFYGPNGYQGHHFLNGRYKGQQGNRHIFIGQVPEWLESAGELVYQLVIAEDSFSQKDTTIVAHINGDSEIAVAGPHQEQNRGLYLKIQRELQQ